VPQTSRLLFDLQILNACDGGVPYLDPQFANSSLCGEGPTARNSRQHRRVERFCQSDFQAPRGKNSRNLGEVRSSPQSRGMASRPTLNPGCYGGLHHVTNRKKLDFFCILCVLCALRGERLPFRIESLPSPDVLSHRSVWPSHRYSISRPP